MISSSSPRSFHGGSSGYDPSSGTSLVSSASSGSSSSSDENLPSSSGSMISHHSSDSNGGSGGNSNLSNSPGSSGDQEDRSGNDESDEPEVRSPAPSNNTGSPGGGPPYHDPNLSSDNNSSGSPSNNYSRPLGNSNPQHVSPKSPIQTSSSSDSPRSQLDDGGSAATVVASDAPPNVQNLRLNSGPPSFAMGQGAPAIASPIFNSNDGMIPPGNKDLHIGPPVTLYRSTIVDGFSTRPNGLSNRQFRPAGLMLPGPDPDLDIEITPESEADDHPVNDIKVSFDISEYSVAEEDSSQRAQRAQRPNLWIDTSCSCSGSSPRKRRRSSDTDDEGDAHDAKRRNLSTSSNMIVQASRIMHTSAVTPQEPQIFLASSSNQESTLRKRRRSDNDDYGGARDTKRRCFSMPSSVTVWASSITTTSVTMTREPQSSLTPASSVPFPDIASPTDDMVSGSANTVLVGSDGSGSGNASPLMPPHFDHEIPDLYHSGVKPRPHYDWYEQYHAVGSECAKVHGCTHNPGRCCHGCHAAWQRSWSQYFKAEELLNEAAANPESYLEEMDIDMRQDYMGVLMQGSGWEVLAPELQPPAGGSLRLHPTRIAKHRLALAQMASVEW
ncbi:hypothetical protein ACHAQK_004053 [Fusarium lateritium]